MLPYFDLFGIKISSYGLCAIIGAVAAVILVWFSTRKRTDINRVQLVNIPIIAMFGVFVGAHLLYAVTQIHYLAFIFESPEKVFASWELFFGWFGVVFGGMVFYGGFIGGLLAALIYCKAMKLDFMFYADIYVPAIPLFHAFGRIGCFLGGCCYGIESHFGVMYNGVERFPVQIIECVCNLLLVRLLFYLSKKNLKKGTLLSLYLIIYPVIRFTLEFFRGDEIRGFLFGISTSQWISIALFIAGVIMMFKLYSKNMHKKDTSHENSTI
ncbi:MAG: prolipoprotein diacylglyceryl transferase [Clostridia bacterium]|nr:prolipoprotein diacylglyceryl transferase [Clostridia bacterium]